MAVMANPSAASWQLSRNTPPPTSSSAALTGSRARSSLNQSWANFASAAMVSNSGRNFGACASRCERMPARNASIPAFAEFRALLNANTLRGIDRATFAGRHAPILMQIARRLAHQRLRADQCFIADGDMMHDCRREADEIAVPQPRMPPQCHICCKKIIAADDRIMAD